MRFIRRTAIIRIVVVDDRIPMMTVAAQNLVDASDFFDLTQNDNFRTHNLSENQTKAVRTWNATNISPKNEQTHKKFELTLLEYSMLNEVDPNPKWAPQLNECAYHKFPE